MILALPRLLGEVGVWLAFPVAEFLSFCVAAVLIYLNRDNYGYGKSGIAYMMQGTPYPADEDDSSEILPTAEEVAETAEIEMTDSDE